MMNAQRIIWLASFPKSGNTWMRILLANYFLPKENAIDINNINKFTTADVRQDFFDKAYGRPFDRPGFETWAKVRNKALQLIAVSKPNHHFVKTHSCLGLVGKQPLIPPEVTAGAIYIIRNPFDVVPSYARHLSMTIDETIDQMANGEAMNSTDTGIQEILGRWDDHIHGWTHADGLHMLTIRYEDMLDDTLGVARTVLSFLGQPQPDLGKLRWAIRRSNFKSLKSQEEKLGFRERPAGMKAFFASGKSGGWRDALTPAQVARIRAEFLPTLERHWPELLAETEAMAAGA